MAEKDANNAGNAAAANNGNNSAGADPTKTDNGASGTQIDTSKWTQADWDKVYSDPKLYENPRFKGLNERAQKAKELEDANKKAEEDALAKNKQFEELATRREAEANQWKSKAEQATIDNQIAWEAQKLGVSDMEAATKLIDRSKISIGADGQATGIAEAVKALVESKPYLKGKMPNNTIIGGGTNPSNEDTTTPRFKLSQLQDARFFREHNKNGEIDRALKLGLVENDTGARA